MEKKDYYQVMGLKKEASAAEIKTAYRRLARKYHPDLNKAPDAEMNFKALGEAYEVLKDPKKRAQYDHLQASEAMQQERADSPSGRAYAWSNWGDGTETAADNPGAFDADLFESLFGGRGRRGGDDIHGALTITLQEAFDGGYKDIELPSAQGASQKIRVKIPAGVKSEQKIRLSGMGRAGVGGQKGDLYITISVQRDPLFDIVENDVYVTLPIAPWEAALGATVKVPTLGGLVDLKIPAHSQGGQTLRLKKRGLPARETGDQYVLLKIVIPQPSTPSAKAMYEAMAKEMPFNPRQHMEARYD